MEGTNKIVLHCTEVRKGNFRLKQKEQDCMNRIYQLAGKGTQYVSEMLKQKIKAGGIKIKRYNERWFQLKEKHLFRTNQKLFYETLDKGKREETESPNPTAATEFWRNLASDQKK